MSSLQKQVKVFAFEPIQPIFEVLQANVNLHCLQHISLFNHGLSSENNHAKSFTFYPNMAGNSTTKPLEKLDQREVMNSVLNKDIVEYLFQNEEVRGKLTTLSSVINDLDVKNIDLLKIDVEGAEYEVLQGIAPDDWRKIKQIVLEVHDLEGRLDKIQALLKSNGFNITVERNNLIPATLKTFNLYAINN